MFSRQSLPGLRLGLVSLILLMGTSCRSLALKEEADFGLRRVSLEASPEDFGLLQGQVLSKRPVKASIHIDRGVQVDCTIAYAGGGSLEHYRKSFDLGLCDARFNQRNEYRVSAQDYDPTVLRALLAFPLYAALGLEVPELEPASLYLNKNYLGLYLLSETVSRDFFTVRGYQTGVIYKARFGNGGFQADFLTRMPEAFSVEGEDDYALLRGLYELTTVPSAPEVYAAEIGRLLDVDLFLRYMAANLYTCQWDGFHNNYFLALDEKKKKLIVAPWDMDRTWEQTSKWNPRDLVYVNRILERLLEDPASREKLRGLLVQLQGEFPLSRLQEELARWGALTAEAYAADPVLKRRPQAEVLAELNARMEEWLEKIADYVASLDPAS